MTKFGGLELSKSTIDRFAQIGTGAGVALASLLKENLGCDSAVVDGVRDRVGNDAARLWAGVKAQLSDEQLKTICDSACRVSGVLSSGKASFSSRELLALIVYADLEVNDAKAIDLGGFTFVRQPSLEGSRGFREILKEFGDSKDLELGDEWGKI